MGIILNWNSTYPAGGIDNTVTNFPTVTDGIHDVLASHVNSLASAVIELETAVGTSGGLTVEELDGSPSVVPVQTIVVDNGSLTDLGSNTVRLVTGGGTSSVTTTVPVEFTAAVAITAGQVLTSDGLGQVTPADASNGHQPIVGIALTSVAGGATVDVAMFGKIDGLIGLSANTPYFLGSAGALTSTAPSSAGDIQLRIGWSISTTELVLHIGEGTLTI